MGSFRNGTKQNFRHKWLHQTIEPLSLSLSIQKWRAVILSPEAGEEKSCPDRMHRQESERVRERASERASDLLKLRPFPFWSVGKSPLLSSTGLDLEQDSSDYCETQRRTNERATQRLGSAFGTILALSRVLRTYFGGGANKIGLKMSPYSISKRPKSQLI